MTEETRSLEEKREAIRKFGLTITQTKTQPTRASKKPRDVWEIDGVNKRKYEYILRDQLGLKMWRGKFTAWSDPTDALLAALEEGEALTVAEIQEYAADRSLTRAQRFSQRSSKAVQERNRRRQASSQIAEQFYGGQPILVGHHSERRARRAQARMWNHMTKSVAADKKAKALDRRAAGAESRAEMKTDYTLEYAGNRLKEAKAEFNTAVRNVTVQRLNYVWYRGDNADFKDQQAEVLEVSKDRKTVNLCFEQKNADGETDWPTLMDVPMKQVELVASEAYLHDQALRRKNAEEAIAHWTAEVVRLGGDRYSKDTIKVGDFVCSGCGLSEVVRVNAKSVTVKTEYSWTEPVPYHKIKQHFTAAQVKEAQAKKAAKAAAKAAAAE
jgi:hypothetical protein